ncbi:putative ABC transport system ATP-binding protein [Bifidobacterium commune]|uniref:Putative ABC transport system ATP-binding protein n=1 Tax=Bifidobacterium commune TaxID=1505727 RepID=A0A1C4H2I2_9BIFI|nr:ATP-binding cassette domain-containing protein [Bifidobacterium commune]MBB2954919.1 putative ABC transport system ATP-binding protein [Bifidobacterium commune]SCC79053.1 putative ABC transport system ATP-binding protein [Bifidobacterium commune]
MNRAITGELNENDAVFTSESAEKLDAGNTNNIRLALEHCSVKVDNGINDTKEILVDANLALKLGDFVTVLGGNGAGKSTLFNVISGGIRPTTGQVLFNGENVTSTSQEVRAKYIARVFQDPKMGTAPRMTVAENLLLATRRGQKRRFKMREMAANHVRFLELCRGIGNGLEEHLNTPAGNLSGGQRQALSLIMATITKPDLLLLDEHTAALDPKTAKQLMSITASTVTEQHLTCLMITHRLDDALKYGNRLIVLQKGQIVRDLDAKAKADLTMNDLLEFFEDGF